MYIEDAFIQGFRNIGQYIGIVLPFSIAVSFTDMMCLLSVQKAGDPYPIREMMNANGIGTLIDSLLRNSFGTVIYIGHHKYEWIMAMKTSYPMSMMLSLPFVLTCISSCPQACRPTNRVQFYEWHHIPPLMPVWIHSRHSRSHSEYRHWCKTLKDLSSPRNRMAIPWSHHLLLDFFLLYLQPIIMILRLMICEESTL